MLINKLKIKIFFERIITYIILMFIFTINVFIALFMIIYIFFYDLIWKIKIWKKNN